MVTKIKPYRIRDVNEPEEGKSLQYNDPNTFVRGEDGGGGGSYVAGENIQINGNVISATDTTYIAGRDVEIVNGAGGDETVTGNTSILLKDAVADGLNSVTVKGGTKQGILPEGYSQLEYIQGDGKSYIDTGVNLNSTIEYEIKIAPIKYATSTTSSSFGGWSQWSPAGKVLPTISSYFAYRMQNSFIAGGAATSGTNIGIEENQVGILSFKGNTISWSEGSSTTFNRGNAFSTAISLYMFGSNNGGTASEMSTAKIYYAKRWSNGELVRDMIPAMNSRGVAGMYDMVSGTFFTNSGTGKFIEGGAIPSPSEPIDIWTNNGKLELSPSGVIVVGSQETITDNKGNTALAETLLRLGNFVDEQNILTGEVIRRVGVMALTGGEKWVYQRKTDTGYNCFSFTYTPGFGENSLSISNMYSLTKAPVGSSQNYTHTIRGKKTLYVIDGRFDTLEAWKQHLSELYTNGNPVIVVYPLAEETTEEVESQTLTTIKGDNTLTITQASIDNLPIEANYNKIGGLIINFVNDDGFQTVANMKTDLNNPDDTHYPTTKAVADAIQSAGGGDMMTSTYDPNNIEADVYDYNNFINTPIIPTHTSDLINDAGFITGIYDSDVLTALGYIPYDSVNPAGYITSSDIPTNVSDFTNDAGYLTSSTGVTSVNGQTGDVTVDEPIVYTAGNGIDITDNEISADTTVLATKADLDSKQDTLVSGVNIKTINNESLLGSGDITISAPTYTAGENITIDQNNEISAVDTTYNAGKGIIIGDIIDRYETVQGPCDVGFHIPLSSEFGSLKNMMEDFGGQVYTVEGVKTYLHMPLAGRLLGSTGNLTDSGVEGYYRGGNSVGNYHRASRLEIGNPYFGPIVAGSYYLATGCSVRPFKDEPVIPDSSWTQVYAHTAGGIYYNSTLGLISLSSDGTNWLTIADKNLGATVVYNNGDALSESNCGKFYQRGNNYGFDRSGAESKSPTKVNASSYGPGEYSSSTFITDSYTWMTTDNETLWANPIIIKNAISNTGVLSVNGQTGDVTVPTHTTITVTLTSAGWSSKSQTVSATGVTASNTVIVSPSPDDIADYADCGVYCSAQASGTLTFGCDTAPSGDIVVNVLIMS